MGHLVFFAGCASTQLITGSQFKISDRNLKASSSSSDTTGPQRSRLNTKKEGKLAGGWSPKVLDKQQWLQVGNSKLYVSQKLSKTFIGLPK